MAINTIVLISKAGRHEEALASGLVHPGDLVKIDSNGKVLVHATAGGDGELLFVKENSLIGKGPLGDIYGNTGNYAIGELVMLHAGVPGDEVQARLKPATTYAVGDLLVSAGDGTLQKASALASAGLNKRNIAVCRQALNLSATAAVATLCPVRLM